MCPNPISEKRGRLDACEEIEVTPEMIEAGCRALSYYRDGFSDEKLVSEVYIAMLEYRLSIK